MINFYLPNEWHNVTQMIEKLIHWISQINEKFKLNFDGLRIENKVY